MIIGGISIAILLFLTFLGVPMGFSLMATGILGVLYLSNWNTMVSLVSQDLFTFMNSYHLGVVVMFMFMGQLGYYSGIMDGIFEAARRWLGRLRGGLGLSVVAAGTAYAACSGSSVASCLIIGKTAVPLMRKAGYSDSLSTGVVASSGCLAAVIPPSSLICIYGLLVNESVGRLLIAGILPGLLIAALYVIVVAYWGRNIQIDPVRFTITQKLASVKILWIVVVFLMAIMGGMYFGICTPTEGGAVGAFVTFLLAIGMRKMNWTIFNRSVTSTLTSACMVFTILVGAVFFSRVLILSGFSEAVSGYITTIDAPRIVVFLFVSVIWLLLGCIVDAVSMLVMTLPIFYPVVLALGYDPIWFGIVAVIYCEIALITPPVAMCIFTLKHIAPDVALGSIIRGVIPFLVAQLIAIAILYIFPEIVLFLPARMTM